jgi:hypothetical protein
VDFPPHHGHEVLGIDCSLQEILLHRMHCGGLSKSSKSCKTLGRLFVQSLRLLRMHKEDERPPLAPSDWLVD